MLPYVSLRFNQEGNKAAREMPRARVSVAAAAVSLLLGLAGATEITGGISNVGGVQLQEEEYLSQARARGTPHELAARDPRCCYTYAPAVRLSRAKFGVRGNEVGEVACRCLLLRMMTRLQTPSGAH